MTDRDPEAYLEKRKEELDDPTYRALEEFLKANELQISSRTLYDYLSRMLSLMDRFAGDDFNPSDPTEEEIRGIAKSIRKSDLSQDTKQTYYKTLKKFYKTYSDGEYYELTDVFTVSGGSRGVEKQMILSSSEVRDIINNATQVRNKAFFRLMYECAVTPGELLDAQLQDVDLEEETLYVRGNKNHRSQTMELHNEGVSLLRDYIKSHPLVDDPFSTNEEEPVWIKIRAYECVNCRKSQSAHEDSERESCDNYTTNDVEPVGYRSLYNAFNDAVERSSVDRDVKMKYFRKSMLTRLCAEGIGFEQLNNFARWVPGSNQAAHYVSIDNSKLRDLVKDKFKEGGDQGESIIECHNCGSRNSSDRLECKKCHRPLNAPKSEKMKKVETLAERLSQMDEERIDRIEQNMDLLENPEEAMEDKFEELFEQKMAE